VASSTFAVAEIPVGTAALIVVAAELVGMMAAKPPPVATLTEIPVVTAALIVVAAELVGMMAAKPTPVATLVEIPVETAALIVVAAELVGMMAAKPTPVATLVEIPVETAALIVVAAELVGMMAAKSTPVATLAAPSTSASVIAPVLWMTNSPVVLVSAPTFEAIMAEKSSGIVAAQKSLPSPEMMEVTAAVTVGFPLHEDDQKKNATFSILLFCQLLILLRLT
jgi:hypothetical protein